MRFGRKSFKRENESLFHYEEVLEDKAYGAVLTKKPIRNAYLSDGPHVNNKVVAVLFSEFR